MKARQLLVLTIVFLIIAGLFIAKNIFIKQDVEIEEYKSLDINFDASYVNEIEIKGPGAEKIRLIKKDDHWVIASRWDLKAENSKIEKLLDKLNNLTGELRSTSKDLLGDYGITTAEAYSVVFSGDSGGLQKFLIGTEKSSFSSTFLRKSGSNHVYLVNADVFSLFGVFGNIKDASLDQNFWIDLRLLQVDIDEIESIQITKLIENLEVSTVSLRKEFDPEKNLKYWTVLGNKPAFDIDISKIKNYLVKLSNLRATSAIAFEEKDYGLERPFIKIVLGEGNIQKELIVGDKLGEKSKERYASTSKDRLYTIANSRVEILDIDISKFFITPEGETIEFSEDLIKQNTDYIENR